jgi:iron complex outermembrane recepter protein
MVKQWQLPILLTSIFWMNVQPSWANRQQNETELKQQKIIQRSSLDAGQQPLSGTINLAQSSTPAAIQVTDVRINQTDTVLEIVLITKEGGELQTSVQRDGNRAIVEVSNAILTLPNRKDFQVENPVAGVARVTVSRREGNRLEVRVEGEATAPEVAVKTEQSAIAAEPDPEAAEEEELTVVGTRTDDSPYFTPNATTGTRTDTPLRDIPQSIQVIPKQILKDQRITRLEEALNNISGFNYGGNFAGTGTELNLRGFSNVPVLRDGFRQFSSFSGGFPETANLEQVEVLKGPSSVLYGEIEPGGLVNLVSKQPLSKPFYEGQFQAGSYGFINPQIDFSGPLTADQRLRYRLNALYRREDGFLDDNRENRRLFIAPIVSWKIDDRTDLSVQLEYSDDKRPFEVGLPAFGEGVLNVPRDRIINEPNDFAAEQFLNVGYNLEHRFNDNWKIRSAFRYFNRDLQTLGALPLLFDEATASVGRLLAQQELETQNYALQTSVIGKFATGPVKHTLLFGVDFTRTEETEVIRFDSSFSDFQFLDVFNPAYGGFDGVDPNTLPLSGDTITRQNRLGVFLQDQIAFTDNLLLLLGLRYDTVQRRTIRNPTDFDFNPLRSEISRNDSAWSPRIGLVYKPIPSISLYGSYSQSFTPSTDTTANGEPLEAVRGQGFEAGIKTDFLKGRLAATLAYFDITRQNVPTPDPSNPLFSIATGEQRSRGVELDVTGQILPGWNIIASYAYTNARVTEDNDIPIGNRLFNAPEHSASLWSTYEIQRGSLRGLGFGLGFKYVGERQGDLQNTYRLDSYFLTNAAVYYRRKNWQFALNFKNLFNVDYIAASRNSRGFGNEPGAPFTIIGTVSVQF